MITQADGSRVSIALIRLSLRLYVYPHDKIKPKRLKLKSPNLGTGVVHHDTSPTNECQRSRLGLGLAIEWPA